MERRWSGYYLLKRHHVLRRGARRSVLQRCAIHRGRQGPRCQCIPIRTTAASIPPTTTSGAPTSAAWYSSTWRHHREGHDRIWGNTAVKENGVWHQIQHARAHWSASSMIHRRLRPHRLQRQYPERATDRRPPTLPPLRVGILGTNERQHGAVVAARGTYANGPRGQASPLAYGAYVADTIFPDVLTFKVGSKAMWTLEHGHPKRQGPHRVRPGLHL